MRRYTQKIEECYFCGKVFEDGEDYWKDSYNKCYCIDNKCGWEDDEDEEDLFNECDASEVDLY